MAGLAMASLAFVGSHFLLSHPLRAPAVAKLGKSAFAGIYSLIAFITLGAMIWAYRAVGDQIPLWQPGEALWIAASVMMWLGSILLVGSFVGNPAFPGAPSVAAPSGVLAITRHPMMWGFAIWALVHICVVATPKVLLFDGAILFLAMAGSVGQDRKKQRLMGERWHQWSAQTAFWPFARGLKSPGAFALIGGSALFLLATWTHGWLGVVPPGAWPWTG